MKQLLPIFSIAVTMAACTTTPEVKTATIPEAIAQPTPVMALDTAGLAEYQAWKVQNELREVKDYGQSAEPERITSKPKARKTKKTYTAPTPNATAPMETNVPSTLPSNSETTASNSDSGTVSNEGGAASSESSQAAKAEEKKGWSKSAKGAVIGGVVGAGAGAVINKKNPVVGAVIGGVLGAGGGYVIGRKMDKKDEQ